MSLNPMNSAQRNYEESMDKFRMLTQEEFTRQLRQEIPGLSASAPTPPHPPPARTDTGVIEPDEQWKADLRKSIEHDLRHMVEDAQIVRDTILGSQPSERSREGVLRGYEESMNNIRMLAQEEFTRRLRQEISELSASMPTPPPPPPARTDTGVIEPDEQWKADLRKSIEHDLRHMVEDARIVRDTILGSQPSEKSRERVQRDYEESMKNIRMLAQEEFTRRLRQEMSERKWALDVIVSNSPDVARQQQWILDNIRKADEERIPFPPTDAPQDAKGVLSASPQQGDSEQGADESSEEGYGTGGLEDESEELEESTDEGEDEDEVDHKLRQSRPHVPVTQPLHSRSPVSRRNAPHQRQPPNSQLAEDNNGDDADDPHRHPAWQHETHASQPYSLGGAPRRQSFGSQASVWRPSPRAPEPSGISRTFAHANGQVYNTGPVQFRRHGSVNSTGSNSSAGLHRAGSINSGHHRSSSVARSSSERPSTQSRDRINIAPRERQTFTSASPHDRPSPPTFPTPPRAIPGARPSLEEAVRLPTSASPSSRAIYAMQRSPEDMRKGMPIPRGPSTPEEGPRGLSWGFLDSRRPTGDFSVHRRHNSKGEQRLAPVNGDLSDGSDDVVGHLDGRQSVRSTMSIEQRTAWWETETRRKEEEANRKEEEANRKEEEARRLEEKARRSLEEARRIEAAAQSKEAEAKHKEAEAKKREAEAQRKEEDAQRRELEAQRKEEKARRKEEDARKREEEIRRKEDDARKREDDARRMEEDARQREMLARQKGDDARRFEEEARKKDEEARKREDEQARIAAKIAGMGGSPTVEMVSTQPSVGPVSTPSPPLIPVRPEEETTPGSARRDIVPTAVPSQMTSDDLLALWGRVGVHVAGAATLLLERSKHKLVGNGSYEGFIDEALAQVPNALHPQSRGEYGILIYAQTAVQVHTCVTDILPGDVIVLNAAKLKGRDGLRLYSNSAGEGAPCIGVVSEFEVRKLKLRALQANQQVGRGTQAVESVSYRLGDLKSGTIKVYRVREA